MRQIALWLTTLYPQAWQQRYGDEYRAMIEQMPLRPLDFIDLLMGAADAHLNPRRFLMQESKTYYGTAVTLLITTVLMLAGMFGANWMGEESTEFLVSVAPLLTMVAAGALYDRFAPHRPARSRLMLRWAQVEVVALAAVFIYGSVWQLFNAGSAPLIGLFWLLLVAGFLAWIGVVIATGLQTGQLNPILAGVGASMALFYGLVMLSLFTALPFMDASLLVLLWIGTSLAWIASLGVSVLMQSRRAAVTSQA